jgi:sterol desaturase/sphingolipid hydroxylase (fatty acid hydroxylase superfamily)
VLTLVAVRWRIPSSTRWHANVALDLAHVVFRALLVVPLTALLFAILDTTTSSVRLDLLAPLPFAVQLLLYVVLVDLFEYGVHRVFHRVPALWQLHAIHHSQRWVGPLTTTRTHPVELIIKRVLSWAPLLVLGNPTADWVVWIAIDGFWGFFVHSGLPITFGPLGRVIVSPRFHTVHHAEARAYHDSNFGERLAIWDVLFGTARFDAPADATTGIDDPDFPVEREADLRSVATTFTAQLAYPFRAEKRRRTCRLVLVLAAVLLALAVYAYFLARA